MDGLVKPQLPITPVSAEALEPERFPGRGASFGEIVALAYTYDGYERHGMEGCAEKANAALSGYYRERILPEGIETLRTCLFFEARRWQLHRQEPDTKGLLYIHALIGALAAELRSR